MRAINVFLSIVVSLLLAGLVFEAGLRLLGKGPPDTLVDFDPRTGWSKKPDHELRRRTDGYDVTIRTNALGLHDDPMESPAKAAGTFRVLALGDSFTQGFSVDRDHLFVDQLERWWQAEGRPVDVVNAGTEAYDTAQEAAWLLEHGADYQPDLVLLFPFQNDLYWNSQLTYASGLGERAKPRFTPDGRLETDTLPPPEKEPWLARTATGRLFDSPPPMSAAHFFDVPGQDGGMVPLPREFAPLLETPPDFLQDVRAHTRGALLAFRDACRQMGAKAAVVPIPDASRFAHLDEDGVNQSMSGRQMAGVAAAWSADRPVDLVLELCREVGLETLDPRDYLAGRSDAGEELYFDRHDWHFTPGGNAAFASFLHERLSELVPPAERETPMPPPPDPPGGVPFALKLYLGLWAFLTLLYWGTYRDEPRWRPPLAIAALLAVVFALFLGVGALERLLPPQIGRSVVALLVLGVLTFVAVKLGRRLGTIAELLKAFTLRGHWYLMPLVVVLLTIGSLLVVAASSPLVAPFIYTLF